MCAQTTVLSMHGAAHVTMASTTHTHTHTSSSQKKKVRKKTLSDAPAVRVRGIHSPFLAMHTRKFGPLDRAGNKM
jgi:hypothetical protein